MPGKKRSDTKEGRVGGAPGAEAAGRGGPEVETAGTTVRREPDAVLIAALLFGLPLLLIILSAVLTDIF